MRAGGGRFVDSLAPPAERLDGPARIERFLASPSAATRFEQEAKVLRQLLGSDAGLYVVDARDPVLPKHKDELALLASCSPNRCESGARPRRTGAATSDG